MSEVMEMVDDGNDCVGAGDRLFIFSVEAVKADGTKQHLLPSALLSCNGSLVLWSLINRLPDYYQTRDKIKLFGKFGAQIARYVPDGATLIDSGAG
ncbi:hypothetical protein GJ744_001218 [Endocarpon pusillum]|uniref:Histidine-specific methyltransferase SAM-dependent domain-containing protein n=1 Tax=Endocarpon pusillum TaxID=364733 RepID=A0A8H7E0R4_9EURO|nr:hypothetical protein GJ744_001218 [Endocarpon pusillum]